MGSLLYQIVADQIREKINARDWMAKLPSEAELCKMFNVSRITLRRSIQELCNEGLVMKRHGLGMYVEKDDYNPDKISADRLFSSACHYRTIQVLRNIKPGGGAAKALLLKPGEKVVEAQRLSYYGDIPVSYLTIRIPEKIYKDRFFEDIVGNNTMIPSLKKIGIVVKRTTVTIEPVILKERHPLILMDKGEPALFLRRVGFDEKENPVFVIEHLMNGMYSGKILNIHTVH